MNGIKRGRVSQHYMHLLISISMHYGCLPISGRRALQAQAVVTVALKRVAKFNRRTLDAIAARLYFYLSLTHEHSGTLSDIRRWVLLCHLPHS